MSNTDDITRGSIVLTGLVDENCFTSFKDFVNALPRLLSVSIPSSVTNVIVSNVQPSDSQVTSIWFRLSNSGSFLGLYVFSQGAWRQIFPVNTDLAVSTTQVFWLAGDSTQPPPGFQNTDDYVGFTSTLKTALHSGWVQEGSIFTYYSAVFISF